MSDDFLFGEDELALARRKSKRKKALFNKEDLPTPQNDGGERSVKRADPGNIGVIVDVYQCKRCEAAYFDIAEESQGWWLLYCAFCGAYQWEVVHAEAEEEGKRSGYPGTFVLRDGIHAGKNLNQVFAEEGGLKYIEFQAKKSRVYAVQQACSVFACQQKSS